MPNNKKYISSSDSDCPCKSGERFNKCCAPILADHSLAVTPESLMRSRYTAFVLEDSAFLLRSWDISTRPSVINFAANVVWLNLVIEAAPLSMPDDDSGFVTYKASFIENGRRIEMTEKSLFLKKKGLWFYLNGELSTQEKAISQKEQCPCGSGKKYKRCCGR